MPRLTGRSVPGTTGALSIPVARWLFAGFSNPQACRRWLGIGRAATVAMLLSGATELAAECRGHDIFPVLESNAPLAFAAIQDAARVMPYGIGRMFKLSRAGLRPSYLFATVHLADPRITKLSPQVMEALQGSAILALEAADARALQSKAGLEVIRTELQDALLARPEQRADQLLDPRELALLEAEIGKRDWRGIKPKRLKPIVLALWLDTPACALALPGTNPVLDAVLADIAQRAAIATVGLETLLEQLQILDTLAPAAQRDLLLSAQLQAPHAEDSVETTIQRYLGGQTGALVAWMRSPDVIPGLDGAKTPPEFLDLLLDQRNKRMLARALPLLQRGGAFIAVGAAHLPGSNGLANLIAEQGFQLDMVE